MKRSIGPEPFFGPAVSARQSRTTTCFGFSAPSSAHAASMWSKIQRSASTTIGSRNVPEVSWVIWLGRLTASNRRSAGAASSGLKPAARLSTPVPCEARKRALCTSARPGSISPTSR